MSKTSVLSGLLFFQSFLCGYLFEISYNSELSPLQLCLGGREGGRELKPNTVSLWWGSVPNTAAKDFHSLIVDLSLHATVNAEWIPTIYFYVENKIKYDARKVPALLLKQHNYTHILTHIIIWLAACLTYKFHFLLCAFIYSTFFIVQKCCAMTLSLQSGAWAGTSWMRQKLHLSITARTVLSDMASPATSEERN